MVIFMGLGRAKRFVGREGFKVIIWGRASQKGKEMGQFFWVGVDTTPF